MSLKEVNTQYSKFDKIHTNVNKELDNIESGQCESPQEKLQNDVAPQVKELFNCLETLKFAYRDLPDVDKQANRKKFKQYKTTYVDVLNRVKDASNKAQRNELLSGPGAAAEEDSTEDRYIAEGENILDDNQRILQETLARVGQSREIGMSAQDKLHQQNQTLMKVSDDLDQMESSLDVSKKVLRQMGVKLVTDKYIWILLLLVCIAIVAIFIILKLWGMFFFCFFLSTLFFNFDTIGVIVALYPLLLVNHIAKGSLLVMIHPSCSLVFFLPFFVNLGGVNASFYYPSYRSSILMSY
jgi:hypothetical protein